MPRPAPVGSVALVGARVVTMKGDEVLPNADIVITGNRIAAVGPRSSDHSSRRAPPRCRRHDSGPGPDRHARAPALLRLRDLPETKWEYTANLAYGVTTVYDPSAPSLDVFAQAELVEAGRMLGPRVLSSGMVLYGGQQTSISQRSRARTTRAARCGA